MNAYYNDEEIEVVGYDYIEGLGNCCMYKKADGTIGYAPTKDIYIH